MATDKIKMNDDDLDLVSGGTILPCVVQQGDSLKAIADKYHVTVEQLMKWNHIENPDIIKVGQQLRVLF